MARKRFGQHFLHDRGTITKIVRAIAPRPGERIVEIGPGRGALTRPLLEACGRLDAVELDHDLVPRLRTELSGIGDLEVHQADALRFDFLALAGAGRLRLVGNLPYNISTPLLFHLLEQADAIDDMHFMLQREVVERMAAHAGDDAYGRLSIMLAWRCTVESLFTVGPGAFTPPPQVESAVVRLVPYREPPFEVADPARFAAIVNRAFSMRRKTLRNALKGMVDATAIEAAGLDPSARPETVAPEGFARLTL